MILPRWACQCETARMATDSELDDRWILGLRDISVGSVEREEFRILIGFGESRALTIEGAATLGAIEAAGPRADMWDDEQVGDDALALLVGEQVLSAVVFKSGALRVVLSSGTCLRVPADDHYEAWQLSDAAGSMFVSLPGGGVAEFPEPA